MASVKNVLDIVDDYELIHCSTLGRGGYGKIYLGRNTQSNNQVAIKAIEIPEQVIMKYVDRELELLSAIQHPHIVHLNHHKKTEDFIYLVLKLCDYNLQQFAYKNELDCRLKEQYTKDSCSAMRYMHENHIMHRDIKPENILVKKAGNSVVFKFSDLGLSRSIPALAAAKSFSITPGVGTVNWRAPEVTGNSKYGFPADMYSFGLTGLSVLDKEPGNQLKAPDGQCIAEFMNDAQRRDETVQIPDVSRSTDSSQIRRLKEIYVRTLYADLLHTRLTIKPMWTALRHIADHWKAQPSEASSAEAMPPPPSSAEALAPSLSSVPVTAVHSADVGSSVHLSAAMDRPGNRQDVHSPDVEANISQLAAMDLSPKKLAEDEPKRTRLSRQIVCGPPGLNFKKSGYLTFDCSPSNLLHPWLPELYRIQSTERAAWEKIDKALFSTTKVSAEIDHFSDYQVVSGPSGVTERRTMVVLVLACKEGSTINGLIVITDIGHRQDALALLPHGQVIAEEHEHITRGGALEVHVNEHHWQPMSDRLFDRPLGERHTKTFLFTAHAEATSYTFNVKIQNGTATPEKITNQMEFGVGTDEDIRDDISTDVSLAPSVEAAVERYIDEVKQARDFPISSTLQCQIVRELENTEAGRKLADHLVAICGMQPHALCSSETLRMCLHVWQVMFRSNTVEDLSQLARAMGCQELEDIIESFLMSQSKKDLSQST